MPYTSDRQRRWVHSATGTKALGGPAKVAEWDAASKGKNLPEKAGGVVPKLARFKNGGKKRKRWLPPLTRGKA